VVLAAYPQGRVQLLAARNADDEWISAAEHSVATHPDGPHRVGTVHQNVSLGQKTLGVVVLDTDESIAPRAKAAIGVVAQRHRLRLEAATVFGEVRQIATREERLRLSREIHDGIAQDVAALAYSFDDALSTLDEPSARRLRPLREDLSRIIRELRLSVFDLRDSNAPQLPLSAAISEHARRTASLAHLELHLSVHVDDSPLDADVERELTRIAQEAVTNARKHSGARTLWVRVETDRRRALVEVADDGVGIVAEPRYSTGSGLRIMRERASTIGAEFSIGDRPGGGTVLRVTYGGDHQ
jgi:signal transduction histidine kinase